MAKYRLTKAADGDLDHLYIYGAVTFGVEQADRYSDGLLERLDAIAREPRRFREVPEIKPGLRRSVYSSHSIYYRIDEHEIVIVRILGQQNLERAFRDGTPDAETTAVSSVGTPPSLSHLR